MRNGKFSWYQVVDVRFDDGNLITETVSWFEVLSGDLSDTYVAGNAHVFFVDIDAKDIVVEESTKTAADDSYGLIGIFRKGMSRLDINERNREARIFPLTTSFNEIAGLRLALRYSVRADLQPTRTNFEIPWNITINIGRYLRSLCRDVVNDTINSLKIVLHAPSGCEWKADQLGDLTDQLSAVDHLRFDEDCEIGESKIVLRFEVNRRTSTAVREVVKLRLQAVRNTEEAKSNLDSLERGFAGRSTEELIVFVCDLRGSSRLTINGKAPDSLLRFRQLWQKADSRQFRQIKVIGDMAMVILNPDDALRGGLAEIVRVYDSVLQLGLAVRGGLHYGRAESTGPAGESITGWHIGEEFLGDAVNRGAKVGDFKENDEGLLATREFLDWTKERGLGESGKLWRSQTFGDWKTDLYRIDLRDLNELVPPNPSAGVADSGHFADRLVARAQEIRSRLVVGLDPDIERFPLALRNRWQKRPHDSELEEIIVEFNSAVIDAVADYAVAFKPQAAFYEQYGDAGMKALSRTISIIRNRELPIILDAKRNDIEHTARAYADAWLAPQRKVDGAENPWRVDAITVNGYLGEDGITPFLSADPSSGIFVLAKTSNPSSKDIQDLVLESNEKIYERVAHLANDWGASSIGASNYSRVGMVVGATYPEVCGELRRIAPRALFLMPGIGAQGGEFESIVRASGRDGLGAYAASSRSVLYGFETPETEPDDEWREAVMVSAAEEAKRINKEILLELGNK